MKTLNKIENVTINIIGTAVMLFVNLIGSYEICYSCMDYGTDTFCTAIYMIVVGYLLIKRCVFNCISVIKNID